MPPERVKLVICDVDGVLTDGGIGLDARGEEFKIFSVADGLGVTLLQDSGIGVGFFSSRRSSIVEHRARELGVRIVASGLRAKAEKLEEILEAERLTASEVCYVGDDLLDIPCLRRAGFPVAVRNARQEVKECAEYTTEAAGGQGALREVAEKILQAQGLWESVLEKYR